jgi:hypothetical protein
MINDSHESSGYTSGSRARADSIRAVVDCLFGRHPRPFIVIPACQRWNCVDVLRISERVPCGARGTRLLPRDDESVLIADGKGSQEYSFDERKHHRRPAMPNASVNAAVPVNAFARHRLRQAKRRSWTIELRNGQLP